MLSGGFLPNPLLQSKDSMKTPDFTQQVYLLPREEKLAQQAVTYISRLHICSLIHEMLYVLGGGGGNQLKHAAGGILNQVRSKRRLQFPDEP